MSAADTTLCAMRFRLYPSAAQEVLLLGRCGHARYVWNLGLEQRLMFAGWKGPTPGFNAQAGQQALRDIDQAWRQFFAGTHRRPTWR